MKIAWKYLAQGNIKHAFEKPSMDTALCNVSTAQYNWLTWQKDTEVLKARRKCSNCKLIVEEM